MNPPDRGKKDCVDTDDKIAAPGDFKRRRLGYEDHDGHLGRIRERNLTRLSHDDYTVGWICALPFEMAAAVAMLDETHEGNTPKTHNDINTYTLGRIGLHNVVIACLPTNGYGTNNAAAVAAHMSASFPCLRIRLMVGIGGGVPGELDIRLGDVVVGNAVVQYDLGKIIQDGRFRRTSNLQSPPHSLMTAVAKLQSNHISEPSKMSVILSEMLERYPSMSNYTDRSLLEDYLFDSSYDHNERFTSCRNCDRFKLLERPNRVNKEPKIHYGVIASTNRVMKHGKTRDQTAQEFNVLCFGMEAAGLIGHFPCLVIRGICDYSDSHKNKQWQEYAAATAAAYAKELLSVIHPTDTQRIPTTTLPPPPAIKRLGQRPLTCFIDALDECAEDQVRTMIEDFETLGQHSFETGTKLYICFSSRHYPHISIQHGRQLILEDQVGHGQDLERYVRKKLTTGTGKFVKEIGTEILQKAAGVFMWVVLVVAILNKEFSRGRYFAVNKRLQEIPAKLSELFKDILTRDNENMADLLLCIQWILYAKRPLKREEFYFAVVSGLEPEQAMVEWNPEYITADAMDLFVLTSSKGLAEVTRSEDHTVQFINESVREFLIKDNGLHDLWPNLAADFPSMSHDRLKQCCYNYMQIDISSYVAFDDTFPKASSLEAKELRQKLSKKFPFLQYATRNVLYHADQAAAGLYQDEFLKTFNLGSWKHLNNVFEMYEVRRHTSSVSLLYVLAETNLAELIKAVLHYRPEEFYELGGRYQYPLYAALANSHRNAVKALLQLEHSPSKDDITARLKYGRDFAACKGQTPLSWAAEKGHKEIVQLLLDKGAEIDAKDSNSRTPLSWAAEKGHKEIVQLLLDKGAEIDSKDKIYSQTPLSWAARNRHKEIVQLLLDRGAEIDSKDNNSRTPLSWAAGNGHKEIVQLLLDSGAEANSKDEDGRTPLSWAATNGYESVIKQLLEKEENFKVKDDSDRTPLSWAVENGHVTISKLFPTADDIGPNPKGESEQANPGSSMNIGGEQALQIDGHLRGHDVVHLGPYTDSGYVTLVQEHGKYIQTTQKDQHTQTGREAVYQPQNDGLDGSTAGTDPTDVDAKEIESDEVETVYSDASRLSAYDESYVSELVTILLKDTHLERLDRQAQERVSLVLPELLKAFALRFGHRASTQMHRDIMIGIAKQLMDECFHPEGEEQSPHDVVQASDSDAMTLNEIMNRWHGHQTESGEDNILDPNTHDNGNPDLDSHDGDDLVLDSHDGDDLVLDSHDGDDDQASHSIYQNSDEYGATPMIASYRDTLMKSSAYNWLLATLKKEVYLVPGELNTIDIVRRTADAPYPITKSGLPRPYDGCFLHNIEVSAGKMITGWSRFSIASKDIPLHVSRDGYIPRLKWLASKFVILWDEQDKRGWMINGVSALLHLLRASLEHDSHGELQSAFLFKRGDILEPSEPYKVDSAFEILLNDSNRKIKLYQEKSDFIRLEDRVGNLFNILEKLIDHQINAARDHDLNMIHTPRRYLGGWDFWDLANEQDPFKPYVAELQPIGKGWVDFTRAIYAVTLFGRGFGEIIRPSPASQCPYLAELPKEKYYLATSTSDIRKIMAMIGNQEGKPMKLSDNIVWHTTTKINEPCKCAGKPGDDHSDVVQVLLPLEVSRPLPQGKDLNHLDNHGAIIFGFSTAFKWFWKDDGNPEEGDPPSTSQELEDPVYMGDSGVGSESVMTVYKSLSPEHYTVGVLCALDKELLAIRLLFDERHDDVELPVGHDSNHYALGRIGQHNVVAACLPSGEYGTNPAASAASDMRTSFPAIKFCLMVGIGGGVPSEQNDIRLGDIVVSLPTDQHSGVTQYDRGKAREGDILERTGALQGSPRFLRTAISRLLSDPDPPKMLLQNYIKSIQERKPEYRHPGQGNDILFAADYVHNRGYETCLECNGPKKERVHRPSDQPLIHYGLVESGNKVIKDAKTRDQLAQEHGGILCFEMEAAGVVNIIPCLVIRGICDYADSHKNDSWQNYAAAVAAAYAKLLLSKVRNSSGNATECASTSAKRTRPSSEGTSVPSKLQR
ncbi:hypothetical protein DL771_005587 [Monosporascus sp. 5C6A]|nr:hypothetical protein DL771_005587 [Monosporascus sp. 5C6A]